MNKKESFRSFDWLMNLRIYDGKEKIFEAKPKLSDRLFTLLFMLLLLASIPVGIITTIDGEGIKWNPLLFLIGGFLIVILASIYFMKHVIWGEFVVTIDIKENKILIKEPFKFFDRIDPTYLEIDKTKIILEYNKMLYLILEDIKNEEISAPLVKSENKDEIERFFNYLQKITGITAMTKHNEASKQE